MIAGTDKRIFGPQTLSSSYTVNIYTPPSYLIYDAIEHVHFVNTSSSDVSVSLWIGASSSNIAGTEWFNGLVIPAHGVYDWYGFLKVTFDDFIVGGASVANVITITADGERYPSLSTTTTATPTTTTTLPPTTLATTQTPTTQPPTTTTTTIHPTTIFPTTTTTAPCYTSTYFVSTVQASIGAACGAASAIYLYYNGVEVFSDSSCTTFATNGYYGYAGGTQYFTVSGGSLTGPTGCGPTTLPPTTQAPTTLAPTTTTTSSLCYGSSYNVSTVQSTTANACVASVSITLYKSGPETYTDATCTTFAADGYYGTGSSSYYTVSGNLLTGPTAC